MARSARQKLRAVYQPPDPAMLKKWRREFLDHFDTADASKGGTEATNGLIELLPRTARGFTNLDNYWLIHAPHRQRADQPPHRVEEPESQSAHSAH